MKKSPNIVGALARFIRANGDRWMWAWAVLLVLSGLVPAGMVVVTRGVVDQLLAATSGAGPTLNWNALRPLVAWAVAAAAVALVSQILTAVLAWSRAVQTERVRDRITSRIHVQSARLDLAFYDSPEFFDRLHRTRDEAMFRPAALLEASSDLLQGGIAFIGLASMLVVFGWWVPIAVIAGALLVLPIVTRYALVDQPWRPDRLADDRRTSYLDTALTTAEFAAELRLLGLGRYFRSAHDALGTRLRNERLKLARRRGMSEAAAAVAAIGVAGAAVAWMVRRVLLGAASLGQLAGFYQTISRGLQAMRQLLGAASRLNENSGFMETLEEFFALEPKVRDVPYAITAPVRLSQGIEFKDVTFRYPGTERKALDRFSLVVPAGKTVAIIGANGSGKSTLVKLLSRLYDPESGAVQVDGFDLRRFRVAEWRGAVSVLFQEPARYAESVAENIGIGRLAFGGSLASDREMTLAATRAGVSFAASLPDGFDTVVGRRFENATELSAGEWQRMAMARAFLRPSAVVVFDEPTSGLDPWSEAQWYSRFLEASTGRTSVLITHRPSVAMQADAIHVMDRGRIVESGTHDELVARGGRYAALWVAQARPQMAMVGA